MKIVEVQIYHAQNWRKEKKNISYFYSTSLTSLILSNLLQKVSARTLPMSSFWTVGGFALALFSEAWRPWDHFCNGNWIFFFFPPHSHNSERIEKGFWIKDIKRLLSSETYLTVSEGFPTQVLCNLWVTSCIYFLWLKITCKVKGLHFGVAQTDKTPSKWLNVAAITEADKGNI